MTPSNSSLHALARRSSPSSYSSTRGGNIFRRLFDRADGLSSDSHNSNLVRKVNGASRTPANELTSNSDERVSSLLQSTVLELWREEQTASSVANTSASAEEVAQFTASVPAWKRCLDVT